MEGWKKYNVKDLNSILTCRLCEGYLVDATTLVECLHTFCRGCILRYFENSKTQCPVCSMVYKKKTQCFRSDTQIQGLVYKLVPSLYSKEMQRREDFYRSTGVRAGSSCSDDSVIERERDMINETEEMISQCVGDKTLYFSPEDSISLSLEYYQPHLDTTDINGDKKVTNIDAMLQHTNINSENTNTIPTSNGNVKKTSEIDTKEKSDSDRVNDKTNGQISTRDKNDNTTDQSKSICDKRYLQCPAGVNMKHLQKFVRMKYGLAGDHRVDIIHKGEVLPRDFSLMDVAYTFKWEKKNPMRFFYRIFKPMKIKPIKIINTTLSSGGKQLQIVPVTTSNHQVPNTTHHNLEPPTNALKTPKIEKISEKSEKKEITYHREETESEQQDKEILLGHLQLQSKSKALQIAEAKKVQVPEKVVKECVFEYEEPDQEEIKRFAERRDREWALQKKLEEEIRPDRDEYYSREHYSSKKRKKSKHSKNDSNGHKEKKRKIHADKIHAEITNNDKTDLKLKVKITTNGHKHKHHKIESNDKSELSNKEKLLQMRQIRHKQAHAGSSGDEKSQPAIPTIKVPKVFVSDRPKETTKYLSGEPESKRKRESPKPSEILNIPENNNKPLESPLKPRIEPMVIKSMPSMIEASRVNAASRPLPRPDFPTAKIPKTDATLKIPTVQLERHEHTERHAQKTFLKSPAVNSDRHSKDQKIGQGKMEGAKTPGPMSNAKVLPIGSITTNNRSLDRKIASLQQRCTIEPKNPQNHMRIDNGKIEKKVNFNNDKTKLLAPQYPPGFTVSKIENNVVRKPENNDTVPDNRPSLEITLIPPASTTSPKPTEMKHANKRPPPGTIPLERIKNAVNLKSGISIIPKMLERTDNIGVLDLSKPNKTPESSPRASPKNEPINGLNSMVNRQINNAIPRPANSPNRGTPENKNAQLSNLKMLSTVALEHQTINKTSPNNINKTRPQIPNLHTMNRMPSMQQLPNAIRGPGLNRLPPKLNEIQKFRPTNPQIRNLRPNQNQNIRNIPNPSLLMNRQQQNQTRLVSNSSLAQVSTAERKVSSPKPSMPVTSTTGAVAIPKELPLIKSAILEQKESEKKEISV